MKKILQIFSVTLLSFLAILVLGTINQQKAEAANYQALCKWVNGSQLRCVHPSDNAIVSKVEGLFGNVIDKAGLIQRIASGDHTLDRVISDGLGSIDNSANCQGNAAGLKASCDDLYYNPVGSDKDTVVFENNDIDSGYFQNVKIVCKTYTIGEPKANEPNSNVYAGNFCDAQGYAGSTAAGLVLVGNINDARNASGNNCGIGKTTDCTLAGAVDGKSAGTGVKSNADLAPFIAGVNNTIKLKADTIAKDGDCVKSALSFFLCPLSNFLDAVLKGTIETVEKLLILPPLLPGSGLEKAIGSLTNIANAAYAIIFLIIIFANFIAIPGLDNYTIKKLLPKLLLVIILTQFSFFICSALVDLGNILGNTIPSAITQAYNGKTANEMIVALFNPIKTINTGVADITNNPAKVFTEIYVGVGQWFMLFIIEIVAVVVAFIGMFYLLFRFAAVGVLAIISPIAFASWVLPNTEGFMKWWIKNYLKLILMYVMVMVVFVSFAILNDAFITAGNGGSFIAGIIAVFMPLFALLLVPKLLKWSGSTITAGGKLISESRGGKFATGAAKNAAKKSAQEGGLAQVKGGAMEKFGKVLPGKAGLGLEARGAQLKKAKASAEKDRISKLSLGRQIQLAGDGNGAAKASITEKMSDLSNKGTLTAQEYADLKRLRSNAGQDTSMFTAPVPVDADGKATVSGVFDNPIYRSAGSGGVPTSPTTGGGGGGSTTSTAPTPTTTTTSAPPTAPAGSGSTGGQPGTQSANPAKTRTTAPSTSGWQQRQSGLYTPPSSGNSGGNTTSSVPPLTGPNGQPFTPPAPSGPTSQVPPSTTPPPPPPGPTPGPPPDFP